jgi:anti-sigma factor RsiW
MKEHDHLTEHVEGQTCQDMLSSLSEYIDGELSPEFCSILEQHLSGCERCRVVVNTLKKTVELYQEVDDDSDLPEDVRERLFLRLNLDDYLK